MTAIVQTSYRPLMAPGLEGMISDMTGYETGTRITATTAGIAFGRAVSAHATLPGRCVLGGPNFIGVSVRDITLVGSPIDPLSETPNPLDAYGIYSNLAFLSRGHIWLKPQDIVNAGEPVYYDEVSGLFGNNAAGLQASGWVKFSGNPAAGSTLVINGATLTFVASGATGDQANIGDSLNQTVVNAVKAMNDSLTAGFAALTFATEPPQPPGGGGGSDTILIVDNTAGALTKAITSGPAGMTKSGATLTGGTAAATLVAGAKWLDAAIAGQLARASFGIQI